MNPLDLLQTPGPDDLVFKLVDFLLPADTTNAYTTTLSILASVLLTYATIKLAYFIITATVSAGYTGQVLGDKYHKLWGPIAVILGIGFLTPVWGNGLSAGHHLLRNFIAKPTVNAANAIAATSSGFVGVRLLISAVSFR
jgi:conjugal transfer/type IV secretion protein DotA/TraY